MQLKGKCLQTHHLQLPILERHLKTKCGGGQRGWVEGGTARRGAVRAVCLLWFKARRLDEGIVGYGLG